MKNTRKKHSKSPENQGGRQPRKANPKLDFKRLVIAIIAFVIVATMLAGLFVGNSSCTGNNPQNSPDSSVSSYGQNPDITDDTPTKYGNVDTYTNDSGNTAAKTTDGTEVELTDENLEKLMEEYQAVQGTGSEREKELLDQIQLLLEATQAQQ